MFALFGLARTLPVVAEAASSYRRRLSPGAGGDGLTSWERAAPLLRGVEAILLMALAVVVL